MAKGTVQLKRVEVSQIEGLREEGFSDPIVQFDTQASIQDEEGDDDKEPEVLDLLAQEVGEIFGGCVQQAIPLLDPSLLKMAERRPIPGKYDDESPCPKALKGYVDSVFGVKGVKGKAGIPLLPFPQRPFKDKGRVASKPDLFAEVESDGFARVRLQKQEEEQRIVEEKKKAAKKALRNRKSKSKGSFDPEHDVRCLLLRRIEA